MIHKNDEAKESITTKESTNNNKSIQKIIKPNTQKKIYIEQSKEENESLNDSESVKLPLSRSQYYDEDYEN
jgi:hypothetical protein